jgi:hypothetical protein
MRQKYNRQVLINNIEQQLSNAIIKTNILLTIYKQLQLAFLKKFQIKKILLFEKLSMLLFEKNSN